MPHFALNCPCTFTYGEGVTKFDVSDGTVLWTSSGATEYEQFDVDRKSGLVWQARIPSGYTGAQVWLFDLNGAGGLIWVDTEPIAPGDSWTPYGLRTCHALNHAVYVCGDGSGAYLWNRHTRVILIDYDDQTPTQIANVGSPFPVTTGRPNKGHDILGVVQDVRDGRFYFYLRGVANNTSDNIRNRIYRYNSDMTNETLLYEESTTTGSLLWGQSWLDIDYRNDRLVFIQNYPTSGNPSIKACNLDGSGVTTIWTGATSTSYVACMQANYADSTIYYFPWASGGATSLRSVGLDGSGDAEGFTLPYITYSLSRIGETFPYDDTYP